MKPAAEVLDMPLPTRDQTTVVLQLRQQPLDLSNSVTGTPNRVPARSYGGTKACSGLCTQSAEHRRVVLCLTIDARPFQGAQVDQPVSGDGTSQAESVNAAGLT